ncbi:MAG: heme exporter protein CcmB [Rhodospirillales bacterium]|nr:heme exporter protein CcmB [Rhodospirillales bacterium]
MALLLVRRDLSLAWRQRGQGLLSIAFFLLSASLFPFAIGPDPLLLGRLAPGILWVSALFAMVLSLERVFQPDYEDGSLEQLALSGLPLFLLVLAKALVNWLTGGLPVALASPLVALTLSLPMALYPVLLASLLLGGLCLSLMGCIGAALTLGARRAALLVPLLVLPLSVPVLILGVMAVQAEAANLTARPHLLAMGALCLLLVLLTAFAAPAALRQALD